MTKESIIALTHAVAKEYGIDPILLQAICEKESAYSPWAVRYEVKWDAFVSPEFHSKKLGITLTTEIQLQKMSYGLGQIIGAVARQHGLEDHITRLIDPHTNLEYSCKHLLWLKKKCKTDQEWIASYNGGWGAVFKGRESGSFPNASYVEGVTRIMSRLKTGSKS